jgi:hypothetical protein
MEFLKKNGDPLSLNEVWVISDNPLCEVIDRNEDISLRNKNGMVVKLPSSLLSAKHINIEQSEIVLSKELYQRYFINEVRNINTNEVNGLIRNNFHKILRNPAIVLSKAEYYLLRPSFFQFGKITLGELLEGISTQDIPVFEKLDKHESLLLVSINGSPLSGIFSASFWSLKENKFLNLSHCHLPQHWTYYRDKLVNGGKQNLGISFDFQHSALLNLLSEIENHEKG